MTKSLYYAFIILILIALCNFGISHNSYAGFVVRNGSFIDAKDVPTLSPEEHYQNGVNAFNAGDWNEAATQLRIVAINFPRFCCIEDTYFYLAVSYFNQGELDFANETFTDYLQGSSQPKHYEIAAGYKLTIADRFACGYKKRFFGSKRFPRWAPAKELALEIYDEVIAMLPCHELAARAFYSKGCLLREFREFRESVEAFQGLIRRFPKHELAPESYLAINKIYLEQCQYEFQNPDLLVLAQINLRKFQLAFPREERIAEAEADIYAIKEIYASGFYETGQFFERKKKPHAAIIYYKNALKQFPETSTAQLCKARLDVLAPCGVVETDCCVSTATGDGETES